MVTYRQQEQPLAIEEISFNEWYVRFERSWRQGEHVLLCGTTGTGKTTVAYEILDFRTYVCVLAVKAYDDMLLRFRNGVRYGRPQYKIIQSWPPDYVYKRVILWVKPEGLNTDKKQSEAIYKALNTIYREGCWCIYFDEAGYIAGTLGLGKALGVLLNQGRSSYISVVATMTRPVSMIAQVPRETLNQPRHKLFFKYTDESEIEACAKIAGIPKREMLRLMSMLSFHPGNNGSSYSDFLYIHEGAITIVLNERR